MKLKITLTKSPIATLPKHKATVAALGLRKVGQTVVQPDIFTLRLGCDFHHLKRLQSDIISLGKRHHIGNQHCSGRG